MTQILPVLAFVVLLGAYIFAVLPKGKWRLTATAVYAVLAVLSFGGATELAGTPRPIFTEWRTLKDMEIIGFMPVEGEAIYLWIDRNGVPVAYALPWSLKDAQAIQDGLKKKGEEGGQLVLGGRFESTPDDRNDEVAHSKPPEANPPKS